MRNTIGYMERTCACGCGGVFNVKPTHKNSIYLWGHGRKGKSLPEEHKKKIGIAHKGKAVSETTRKKLSEANLGKTHLEETKQKISDAMKKIPGRPHTEETKKKISERKRTEWAEGVFDKAFINYSSYEVRLAPVVSKLGFEASFEKRRYISKNGSKSKIPDFYNEKTKEVIEIFGEYWHRDRILPNGKKHETPEEVINWYKEAGWSCTVVWAKEEFDEFYAAMLERVKEND